MTRMLDDDFPDFKPTPVKPPREPDDVRKRVFTEQMARLHTMPVVEKSNLMDAATRAELEARDQAQGFIRINDHLTISPTLAKMLHYRAPQGQPSDSSGQLNDAEAQSLDEARR